MISIADLSRELDVDADGVRMFRDQLADDADLVVAGDLTDRGADLVRAAYTADVDSVLENVRSAAAALEVAETAAAQARQARDNAMRHAAVRGCAKTAIAEAAGVSREYLDRVL
jgi:hypothetical protein